jgi:hypothetical protein
MMEQPELVAAEIRAFLDWVQAAGGPAVAAQRIAEETATTQAQR